MNEFSPVDPREGKTGFFDDECLIFGNGVELETTVFGKSPKETISEVEGRTRFRLSKQTGRAAEGVDIVKIHFMPETSLSKRANEPELVPLEERPKIRFDSMLGFLSMAHYLLTHKTVIEGHDPNQDFYLFADTDPGFALFLLQNCNFRGTPRAGEVWIKCSEFISNENLEKMMAAYKRFEAELTKNQSS